MVYTKGLNWHAVSTRSRHEKQVYRDLAGQDIETFLPLVRVPSSRRDRRAEYDKPLFPGYLFIRIVTEERAWHVIQTRGVCTILGPGPWEYTPVPEHAEGPLLVLEFETEYPDMVGMSAWAREQPAGTSLLAEYQAGQPLTTAEALAPGATVEILRAGGASDKVRVFSPQGTELRFLTYYFPGWRVYLDDERLPNEALRPGPVYGLLTVDVPPGEHDLLLRWGDTPLRLTGKILTLLCLVGAGALVMVGSRARPTRED